ncbi:MAG: response regulator transcription factor [Bacteroidia bacterium]|nr:response regulator transcription factor [Bacteroidia bacterium]
MNCIIVDDDKMSRKVLEEFVKRTDSLNLINTYSNAVEAINSLKNCQDPIHLIFLDIEMPDMSGIEFLNTLKEVSSQIIIVSAKDKYAITAFEYDVTDYLLKPITYARFYKAVDKAFKRIDDIISIKRPSDQKEDIDEIFIKKNSTLVRLKYDDILYIEALENYVIVNTYTEKFTIHFTMKSIEDKLPVKKFKRVHRSFIVNINRIKGIEDNSIIIKLEEGIKLLPVGKSYKDKLLSEINVIVK